MGASSKDDDWKKILDPYRSCKDKYESIKR
jgi:hypothetical protein